jgi:hypothetical protein
MTDPEKLAARLRAAVEVVEAAHVPEDLRKIAFQRALDVILGPVVPVAPASPEAGPPGASAQRASSTIDSGSRIAKLAAQLGIEPSTAAGAYDIDDDGLHLVLAPSKFHSNVTTAMEEIARLVVAGRQAAGLDEEWTALNEVRAACENRGRYSPGNFSTYVMKLDGDGFRIRGTGPNRELKVNAAGLEKTGQLVSRLVAQE